jgi:DNA-binding Lrp family transcriptional regulator
MTEQYILNIDKKKKIIAFLEKNPGASVLKMHAEVGIPEWTLRKLVNELVDDKMVVRIKYGWKLTSGADILSGKTENPMVVMERCIRNMINVPK